ncbi:unnamed protein product [Coccothraustes coccothraustes]
MYRDELRGHAGLRGGVLVHTGAHWAAPAGAAGAVGARVLEQKGKSRGAGTRWKQDKPRAQPRQSKKGSPRSSGRPSIQPSPSPDAEPQEPLDVEPILDELLERVLVQSALAAVARQRVPFSVARARDAILFVAEWNFPVRDATDPEPNGDPDPERDGVWKEDEEPPAGLWDSWTPDAVAVAEVFPSSEEVRGSPSPRNPPGPRDSRCHRTASPLSPASSRPRLKIRPWIPARFPPLLPPWMSLGSPAGSRPGLSR